MSFKSRYNKLISKAQSKKDHAPGNSGYDNHHIVPRSMGGLDDDSNMILLKYAEHFEAHYLLFKIHKNPQMAAAFNFMCNLNKEMMFSKKLAAAYAEAREIAVNSRKDNETHEFTNWVTGEEFKGTRDEVSEYSELNTRNISKLFYTNPRMSVGAWCLTENKNEIPKHAKTKYYAKVTIYEFTNWITGEEFKGTREEFCEHSGLPNLTIAQIFTINANMAAGEWCLTKNKDKVSRNTKNKYSAKVTVYDFIEKSTGELFTGTRKKFAQFSGIPYRKIDPLFKTKQRPTVLGWSLLESAQARN